MAQQMNQLFRLFLDMDGVFCDFDGRVAELSNTPYKSLKGNAVWRWVNRDPEFFLNLKWVAGSEKLWAECVKYFPTMLTGLPSGQGQGDQKRRWVARELGPHVPVIVCPRKEKVLQNRGILRDILIDDHPDNCAMWTEANGIAIHHTGNFDDTIARLNFSIKRIQEEDSE